MIQRSTEGWGGGRGGDDRGRKGRRVQLCVLLSQKSWGGREAQPKPNISFISSFLMVDNCGCHVLVLVVGVLVSDSCLLLDVGCRILTVDCRVALLILIPVCWFSIFRC